MTRLCRYPRYEEPGLAVRFRSPSSQPDRPAYRRLDSPTGADADDGHDRLHEPLGHERQEHDCAGDGYHGKNNVQRDGHVLGVPVSGAQAARRCSTTTSSLSRSALSPPASTTSRSCSRGAPNMRSSSP
jgi:hypothetical protein